MIKIFRTGVVIATAVFITGCAGYLNVGSPEFSCPGSNTTGLSCMGVRDLYKATDGPMSSFGSRKSIGKDEATSAETTALQAPIKDTGYEPSPWMDKPQPIRSQAKVMRIWVGPFEDENGDLNAPGMVFTEIEPRRWNVGEGLVKRPVRLTQIKAPTQETGSASNGGSNPFGVSNSSGQTVGNLKNVVTQDGQKGGPTSVVPKGQPPRPSTGIKPGQQDQQYRYQSTD